MDARPPIPTIEPLRTVTPYCPGCIAWIPGDPKFVVQSLTGKPVQTFGPLIENPPRSSVTPFARMLIAVVFDGRERFPVSRYDPGWLIVTG